MFPDQAKKDTCTYAGVRKKLIEKIKMVRTPMNVTSIDYLVSSELGNGFTEIFTFVLLEMKI